MPTRTTLNIDRFEHIGNILQQLSVAYRFTCEKSFVYRLLADKPAIMKITTGETHASVDTSVDFDVQANYSVAVFKREDEILYGKMAVAYDHTTHTISKAVAFNESTNTFTFSAIAGGGVHDVSIFYLLGEGIVRIQVASSGSNIISNRGLIEGSIEHINIKDQLNVQDLLYLKESVELKDSMKLEIAVETKAPIYLDSRDLVSSMPHNISPAILGIPVEYMRSTDVVGAQALDKQTNK